jgi:hypothetical protein
MIAIVKQDNVARPHLAKTASHAVGRLRLPVPPVDRPHDHFRQSRVTGRGKKLGAAKAERRPDAGRPFAGCRKDGIVAPVQFVDDPIPTEKDQAGMAERVIPDGVVCGRDFVR